MKVPIQAIVVTIDNNVVGQVFAMYSFQTLSSDHISMGAPEMRGILVVKSPVPCSTSGPSPFSPV
jgi:hypothetical protein